MTYSGLSIAAISSYYAIPLTLGQIAFEGTEFARGTRPVDSIRAFVRLFLIDGDNFVTRKIVRHIDNRGSIKYKRYL